MMSPAYETDPIKAIMPVIRTRCAYLIGIKLNPNREAKEMFAILSIFCMSLKFKRTTKMPNITFAHPMNMIICAS